MAEELDISFTSVQAVAEIIQARLEPAMRDTGNYELEDICEEVRNAYAGTLWKIHMMNMADGDRTAMESLLQQKYIEATPETAQVQLTETMVVDLPRDGGIYSVTAVDKNKKPLAPALTKTNPAMATAPKSGISPGPRYYRVGNTMYFPEGLPPCTAFVLVVYYGLDTSNASGELIPRDYADMVRDKVWNSLFPSKQVRADVTVNANPNE